MRRSNFHVNALSCSKLGRWWVSPWTGTGAASPEDAECVTFKSVFASSGSCLVAMIAVQCSCAVYPASIDTRGDRTLPHEITQRCGDLQVLVLRRSWQGSATATRSEHMCIAPLHPSAQHQAMSPYSYMGLQPAGLICIRTPSWDCEQDQGSILRVYSIRHPCCTEPSLRHSHWSWAYSYPYYYARVYRCKCTPRPRLQSGETGFRAYQPWVWLCRFDKIGLLLPRA